MINHAESFAHTLQYLGRYGVRKLPPSTKPVSIHKMYRIGRPAPKVLPNLPNCATEIPTITDNPRKIDALGLNHCGYEFTRGLKPTFRIYIPQTVYFILAGLLPFKWRLQAKVTRTLIHLDHDSILETEERHSVRAFLTEKFDTRFPQIVNVHTHSFDLKSDLLVGTLIDFVDQQENEYTLFTGETYEPTPSFMLQCLLNHTEHAVHAPISDTESLRIEKPEIIPIDLHDFRQKCSFLFENVQNNVDNIRTLEDGNYILDGEGPNIMGMHQTFGRKETFQTSLPVLDPVKGMKWDIEYSAKNLIKRGKIRGKSLTHGAIDWDLCTVREKDPNAALIMDEEGYESVYEERFGDLHLGRGNAWRPFSWERMEQN